MPIARFGLAQWIVERFRQRPGAPRRVAEVLLRRHRQLSTRRVFNVGLALHLHRHDAASRMHTIERRITRTAEPAPVALRLHRPPAPFPATMRTLEHVTLERILARAVRRETLMRHRQRTVTGEPSPTLPSVDGRAADAPRPMALVLRRSVPPLAQEERGRPVADTKPQVLAGAQVIHGSTRRASAAPTIPLSPGELARLTDDVVNAIDRRFVALRERRGVV